MVQPPFALTDGQEPDWAKYETLANIALCTSPVGLQVVIILRGLSAFVSFFVAHRLAPRIGHEELKASRKTLRQLRLQCLVILIGIATTARDIFEITIGASRRERALP